MDATLAALKDLGYQIRKEEKSTTSAKIQAVRGDGATVDLTIKPAPGNASDVEIAAAVIVGGRDIAEQIREAIHRRLRAS